MERVVLRHLTGSKQQQVEELPLDKAKDLLIGRDTAAQIRFDPERDDLVGRQHARILQDPGDRYKFSIVDLNSRNGTYVNQQRVVGTVALTPGDVIQLGPGGPEIQFDIDPPPAHLVKATRLAPAVSSMAPTREAAATVPAPVPGTLGVPMGPPKAAVGKETVERMVTDARKESRKVISAALAASILVALALVGVAAWQWNKRAGQIEGKTDYIADKFANQPWTPQRIADTYTASTVLIEFYWKLVYAETGEQIYHEYYIPTDKQGKREVDKAGNPLPAMPIFEKKADGRILPKLVLGRGAQEQNHAIACGGGGSGFVVTTDGFILTNRHVAANWEAYYQCFPQQGAVVLMVEGQKDAQVIPDIGQLQFRWVPAKDGRLVSGKAFEGQNTYLDVTFPLNKLRFPASVARISDRADATLIKINSPQPVKKVELLDNYSNIKVGNALTIIGYPGVSPDVYMSTKSVDALSSEKRTTVIPDPTVTPCSVGRIIRGQMQATQGTVFDYESGFGDTYQLTATATGAGNSGGPVFDDQGRVIGIFTYSRSDAQGTRVTFAVPIKYGIELMGTSPAVAGSN